MSKNFNFTGTLQENSKRVITEIARKEENPKNKKRAILIVGSTGVGKTKMQLFAKGFQGWYVPKNLDIKNYDLGCVEPMSDKDEQETKDFIDEILNGAE